MSPHFIIKIEIDCYLKVDAKRIQEMSNLSICVKYTEPNNKSNAPSIHREDVNECEICSEKYCWCSAIVQRDCQGNVLTALQIAENDARKAAK